MKVNGPHSPYGPSAYASLRPGGARVDKRHADRDTVEISPEAKALLAQTPAADEKKGAAGAKDVTAPAASRAVGDDARAARLAQLKAAIASGTYRVPAEAVAERLLQRLFDEQA
ncbi:flagellar biosynthesis anti-sigma factor FlgM [Calditerricola satsumensis]|uniref:Negative regulator of flagellin synthesis n=2 Tax=Calditerricola satsumensis TaxID=373054 RepID=A0A8J3BCI7_9BACI|nr:flagellar biosynthesis anti-sigma factor FlgM [Calditerricola satsumensis]GGJ94499.1 hypothetical protein GCM10007043_05330 [Calditerricola satsumensis]